jgi:hypothetical protein
VELSGCDPVRSFCSWMSHWASRAASEHATFGLCGRQCHDLLLSWLIARRSGH